MVKVSSDKIVISDTPTGKIKTYLKNIQQESWSFSLDSKINLEFSLTYSSAEPRLYSCSFCQRAVDSAWSLVQHVQTSHGIQIYSEESKPGRVGESAQTPQPDTPALGLSQVQEKQKTIKKSDERPIL